MTGPKQVRSARKSWIQTLLESELPSGAKLVGLVVASHTSALGDHAWPGRERLARLASLSPRRVSGHLATLERAGFLIVTRRNVGMMRLTSLYELAVPGWSSPREGLDS